MAQRVSALSAVAMVVDYIIQADLYNFKSLSEETQARLLNAYGSDFEQKVDCCLGLN